MPNFSGEFTVSHVPKQVYDFLVVPYRLVENLPGLMRCDVQDQDHFSVTLRVGVGRVRGPMTMKIEISEKRQGSYARLTAKGSMVKSPISVDGSFNLSEMVEGTTCVSWVASVKLGIFLRQLLGGLLHKIIQDNLQQFVQALELKMMQKKTSSDFTGDLHDGENKGG